MTEKHKALIFSKTKLKLQKKRFEEALRIIDSQLLSKERKIAENASAFQTARIDYLDSSQQDDDTDAFIGKMSPSFERG